MFYLIRDLNCDLDDNDAWLILETKANIVTNIIYNFVKSRAWHSFNSIIHLSNTKPDSYTGNISNFIKNNHFQIVYSFPSLPLSKHLPNVTCLADFIAQYPEEFI